MNDLSGRLADPMQATTMEMIRRYDRPGPRYTSYPTALEFHPEVDQTAYVSHLEQAARREAPLSFYIHLPFCEERCLFCGCNVVVTKQREIAAHYLEVLTQEVRQLARHPPTGFALVHRRYHFLADRYVWLFVARSEQFVTAFQVRSFGKDHVRPAYYLGGQHIHRDQKL